MILILIISFFLFEIVGVGDRDRRRHLDIPHLIHTCARDISDKSTKHSLF